MSLVAAGTGARVGGASVDVGAGAGRASGREDCLLGEVSSVGPERMLANDIGSAARACFCIKQQDKNSVNVLISQLGKVMIEIKTHTVSLGGEAGRGSRIIDEEYPGAPVPPRE